MFLKSCHYLCILLLCGKVFESFMPGNPLSTHLSEFLYLLSSVMVSKSKEKKLQRKEMFAKLGAAQQLLSKANVPDKDHMATLVPFKVSLIFAFAFVFSFSLDIEESMLSK